MKRRSVCVGDTVYVLAGNDKGKQGKVLRCLKDKVVVEGVNVRVKNIKRSQENPKGKRINIEAPLHISNVRLSIDMSLLDYLSRLQKKDGSFGISVLTEVLHYTGW